MELAIKMDCVVEVGFSVPDCTVVGAVEFNWNGVRERLKCGCPVFSAALTHTFSKALRGESAFEEDSRVLNAVPVVKITEHADEIDLHWGPTFLR